LLRGFWDELHRRGVSLRELESRTGLTRPRVGDYRSTVSRQDAFRLYEAALELTGDEALGISVASALSAASLHLVGQLIETSLTLRQAIEVATSAEPRLREWMPWFEEQPHGRVRVGHFMKRPIAPGARVHAEMVAVFMYKLLAPFVERPTDMIVQLPFAAPDDPSSYLQAFPGTVRFDADGTFVELSSATLARRRSGFDPSLSQHLLQLAESHYGTGHSSSDWAHQVRCVLRAHAAPRLADAQEVAQRLGVSARVLSRRLAREGVSLSKLVDDMVYERAKALLGRRQASIKAVASALGYAETSSFFRAFRRWADGLTPSEYRSRVLLDPAQGAGSTPKGAKAKRR
jgi:AraC-like DNA-binding protein/transcriptional regulator with XRE-family HTH domain